MSVEWPDKDKPFKEQPQLVLAALTCWGEARGEPAVGKRAVLWVVKNRRWVGEVYARTHGKPHPLFGAGGVADCVLRPWQFSCWNAGDPNQAKMSQFILSGGKEGIPSSIWPVFHALAEKVEAETPDCDPTYGATHYCTVDLWGTRDSHAWYGWPELDAGRTKETVVLNRHVFAKVK